MSDQPKRTIAIPHDQRFVAIAPPEKYLTLAVGMLLAEVDEFVYRPDVLFAATGIVRGRLSLYVGPLYCMAPPAIQAEILQHECGHFVSGHFERMQDRQPQPWNMVADSALHHSGVCDWKAIEEFGQTVAPECRLMIFERLPGKDGRVIKPMMAEAAYELLDLDKCGGGEGEGCGSLSGAAGGMDTSPESRAKWALAATRALSADPDFRNAIMGGKQGGNESGLRETPELKPPRPWIRKTIAYLVRTQVRTDRARSFRREHRAASDLLPGQSRAYGRGARFFIDASGSVSGEMLMEFLSAVLKTPELRGSDVVIFDNKWTPAMPVSNLKQIMEAVGTMGGGTCIAACGEEMRIPTMPAVWVTDACTGDGWPSPHTHNEVWCVYGDAAAPPHGTTIRIDPNET